MPLCRWTGVKALIAAQSRWTTVAGDIDCFQTRLGVRISPNQFAYEALRALEHGFDLLRT